jgi:hypothetical protein
MAKFRDGVAELMVKRRLDCHGGEAGREHQGEIDSRVLQSLRKIAIFPSSTFCPLSSSAPIESNRFEI